MRLYPQRRVEGQSFKHVKSVTVPNQSMTLADIIQRFIKKEALPIQHEGTYATGMGDLEKIAREDIIDRRERIDALNKQIETYKRRAEAAQKQKEKEEKEAADKEQSLAANRKISEQREERQRSVRETEQQLPETQLDWRQQKSSYQEPDR